MNRILLFAFVAMGLAACAATPIPDPPKQTCEATITAVRAHLSEGVALAELDRKERDAVIAASGSADEMATHGVDRVFLLRSADKSVGLILFVRGDCIVGRSEPLPWERLARILGEDA